MANGSYFLILVSSVALTACNDVNPLSDAASFFPDIARIRDAGPQLDGLDMQQVVDMVPPPQYVGMINPKTYGSILIESGSRVQNGMIQATSSAFGQIQTNPSAPGTINVEALGPCLVVTGLKIGAGQNVPAGAITISGGKKTVTLMPDKSNSYPAYNDYMNALWVGGETITVSSAGGAAVQAFSTTFVASSSVDITMPHLVTLGQTLTIDRTADLPFQWTGGTVGNLQVELSAGTPPNILVACNFPSAAGTGTIPKAALARLPASTSGSLILAGGGGQFDKIVAAGDYTILIVANTGVTWGGMPSAGAAIRTGN